MKAVSALKKNGVIDRARTGDNQNHNPLCVLLFPLEISSFGTFGHDGSAIKGECFTLLPLAFAQSQPPTRLRSFTGED